MKAFRYAYRIPWLLVQVTGGVLLAVLLLNPISRLIIDAERIRRRLIPWWSRGAVMVFGLEARILGAPETGPVLFAANHLSWIDIEVLHSVRLMAFVAKQEIKRWPLVGWMANQAGTIYHRRGSPKSLSTVSLTMMQRLKADWAVGLFPEGGVGDGVDVLPFHGRLFQCALESGALVQPVAICYLESDGTVNTATPFRATEPFMTNVWRLLGQRHTVVELHFCEAFSTESMRRRDVAKEARSRVVAALAQCS